MDVNFYTIDPSYSHLWLVAPINLSIIGLEEYASSLSATKASII
jgi:hypothetical protein